MPAAGPPLPSQPMGVPWSNAQICFFKTMRIYIYIQYIYIIAYNIYIYIIAYNIYIYYNIVGLWYVSHFDMLYDIYIYIQVLLLLLLYDHVVSM
jgi:hypothetical protein